MNVLVNGQRIFGTAALILTRCTGGLSVLCSPH